VNVATRSIGTTLIRSRRLQHGAPKADSIFKQFEMQTEYSLMYFYQPSRTTGSGRFGSLSCLRFVRPIKSALLNISVVYFKERGSHEDVAFIRFWTVLAECAAGHARPGPSILAIAPLGQPCVRGVASLACSFGISSCSSTVAESKTAWAASVEQAVHSSNLGPKSVDLHESLTNDQTAHFVFPP